MNKLQIVYQKEVRVNLSHFFQKIYKYFLKAVDFKPDQPVSVAFVSDDEIKYWNKRYRNINKITDVLSFEDINEILISYEKAKEQAKEKKHSIKYEVGFLLAHGLLHLAGYDHQTKKTYAEMNGLTARILKQALK